jgi:hypothetical protein
MVAVLWAPCAIPPRNRSLETVHLYLLSMKHSNIILRNFSTKTQQLHCNTKTLVRRLGGVVVNVLATGPKHRGFELGQGDRFL